ncbi:MAG TPA: hypothetical protein VIK40_00420 [Geomonas sp.]
MDEKDRNFIESLFVKQGEQFQRYVSSVSESFDLKIGILADGHQLLTEKLERIEASIGQVNMKIDKVELSLIQNLNRIAVDVAAHRVDTEAHHGIYRVKES